MDLGLKGKTAIITGGATGIGEAAALLFLEEGCNVAVCGRRQEKLDDFTAKANAAGYMNVYTKSVDVSTETGIYDFAHEVVETFGGVDILVNNAGGGLAGALM
ncbi:MAG: SDR family NAD(P)-dependent oxidoreductase, partial [Oscillospiraceae bacterium]|nr:SDR family NAD(P)-dependent oxidoreductase [Oscillospiraceae bacterium]